MQICRIARARPWAVLGKTVANEYAASGALGNSSSLFEALETAFELAHSTLAVGTLFDPWFNQTIETLDHCPLTHDLRLLHLSQRSDRRW